MSAFQKLLRHHKWGMRTDVLAFAIVLAAVSLHTAVLPLLPNDFWWHLKIGEVIATTARIPQGNLFAWTLPPDAPFTYAAWLAEALFYALFRAGGMHLVTFARNVLMAAALVLLGMEAQRRSRSWYLAALAVGLAYVMTLNNVVIRPQNGSWVPFLGFLTLLSRYADGQLKPGWLCLCPVGMAFWVNVHGAFVLGLVLPGAFLVGETLRRLGALPGARSWRELRWLAIITVATALATMLNPQGPGIYGYVLNLMTDQPSQTLIMEWQSPSLAGVANSTFFASILLLLVVAWHTRKRPSPTDVLLVLGFTWLAWSGIRYIVWYAMAVMPIVAMLLGDLGGSLLARLGGARKNLLNLLLVAVLLLPVLAVQPWFFNQVAPRLPAAYQALIWLEAEAGPWLSVKTPLAVTQYLRQHPGGRLFNEMGYGSYFIWALPEQGVFVDPRVELYPYAQWRDYANISQGVRSAVLLAQYDVDRVVLDKALQPNLQAALADAPGWQLAYEDAYAQVWARCPGDFCE